MRAAAAGAAPVESLRCRLPLAVATRALTRRCCRRADQGARLRSLRSPASRTLLQTGALRMRQLRRHRPHTHTDATSSTPQCRRCLLRLGECCAGTVAFRPRLRSHRPRHRLHDSSTRCATAPRGCRHGRVRPGFTRLDVARCRHARTTTNAARGVVPRDVDPRMPGVPHLPRSSTPPRGRLVDRAGTARTCMNAPTA